jgi:hydroxypyruvate reductase
VAHRVTAQLMEAARAAIAACAGDRLVREALVGAARPDAVWAVGKAAASMALGACEAFGLDAREALVIAREADPRLPTLVGAHPVPDESSVRAAQALLAAARAAGDDRRVLLLLSGGASSLVGAPADGVSLDELRAATGALVRSGARIGEINAVRRRLSLFGGGKLAQATRARLDVLALSDVIGSDPAAIGSGPASPDPTSRDEALAVAMRFRLDARLVDALARAPETAAAGDPAFTRVRYQVLADPTTLRDAAATVLARSGWRTFARAALVDGSVEDYADELAARARTLAPGEVVVAAGEPTVRVAGDGLGGRAQHLALRVARSLAGTGVTFVACGSDGSDGPTPAAGAAVDGDTWPRAVAEGLDPDRALERFDSHPLLSRLGATLVTDGTGTNLTDLFLLGRGA